MQGMTKKFHVVNLLCLAGMDWLSAEEGCFQTMIEEQLRTGPEEGEAVVTCASYIPFLPLG